MNTSLRAAKSKLQNAQHGVGQPVQPRTLNFTNISALETSDAQNS